jgi:ferric-dicitrate binding protein FerR (iron transport regulator)
MAEPEKDIWLIIPNILSGEATLEEKALFEKWLQKAPENKRFFDSINQISPAQIQNENEAKERVYARIKEVIVPKQITRKLRFWRYCAAASIAVIVALGAILVTSKPQAKEISYIETQVPNGVKSKITLADGTIVYLNSGTYIKYPAQFNLNKREISLKGEAYFEVAKDPEHPFIVHTDKIDIKVLGTHFNVKTFGDEGFIETTLLEGSVQIFKTADKNQSSGVILRPNQQANYNLKSGEISVKEVPAELATVWKEGKIYFENQPLEAITKMLERNYNVNIRIISPKIAKELYYGMFNKSMNLNQLLDVMRSHDGFKYSIKNDTIFITK